jgi:DNA (cytosine-5)-methyltransferase 1
MMTRKPAILDIFAGCGGLSLGAHQAGFSTALAIDADPLLSSSFHLNFPKAKLVQRDICRLGAKELNSLLPFGADGVVGGPPCQGFSEMGRRDAKDPRRLLVREFFRVVKDVRPKFFLFENVRGLTFPQNISLLHDGLAMLPKTWHFSEPRIIDASDHGAPTKRRRVFVFGFDTDKMDPLADNDLFKCVSKRNTVRDAISDLRSASFAGDDEREFDMWNYDLRRAPSGYANQMRSRAQFTSHRKTEHSRSTLRRFSKLAPGQSDPIGKYVRLKWEGLCPTLRAGTGNDRGSYQAVRPIHPEQDRVITAREAARLQGFPDSFRFHPTVWHSCRMIGNSVSPIVAKAFLKRIKRQLSVNTAS